MCLAPVETTEPNSRATSPHRRRSPRLRPQLEFLPVLPGRDRHCRLAAVNRTFRRRRLLLRRDGPCWLGPPCRPGGFRAIFEPEEAYLPVHGLRLLFEPPGGGGILLP